MLKQLLHPQYFLFFNLWSCFGSGFSHSRTCSIKSVSEEAPCGLQTKGSSNKLSQQSLVTVFAFKVQDVPLNWEGARNLLGWRESFENISCSKQPYKLHRCKSGVALEQQTFRDPLAFAPRDSLLLGPYQVGAKIPEFGQSAPEAYRIPSPCPPTEACLWNFSRFLQEHLVGIWQAFAGIFSDPQNHQKTREGCGCFRDLSGRSWGTFWERPEKIAGKILPESRNASKSRIWSTGKGKLAANLGSTPPQTLSRPSHGFFWNRQLQSSRAFLKERRLGSTLSFQPQTVPDRTPCEGPTLGRSLVNFWSVPVKNDKDRPKPDQTPTEIDPLRDFDRVSTPKKRRRSVAEI